MNLAIIRATLKRDQALERAIEACTALMRTCGEYEDIDTARAALEAQRLLIGRRSPAQVQRMESERGLA